MRIVHILSQKQLTGAEVYALHLAEEQKKLGHDVQIISDKIHLQTEVPVLNWSVHKPNLFQKLKNIRSLRSKIKSEDIHIVHCHSRAAVRLGSSACLRSPATLISTIHGRQHFSWSKKIFDIYGSRVIAICENISEHLKNDFKMSRRKISIIRNPFYFQKSNSIKKDSSKFKLSLVGRFTGPKGLLVQKMISEVLPDLLAKNPHLYID